MSEKYAFIPTVQVVDRLREEGFQPVEAFQSRARIPGKQDFTRHMIRFRQGDMAPVFAALGQLYFEVCLVNSHDGVSAYKIYLALWRALCCNGMIAAAGDKTMISVAHRGNPDGVVEATFEVVKEAPRVMASVEQFSKVLLSPPEREIFATQALALRFDEGKAPIGPHKLLEVTRREELEPTLWNTLNVTQEKLVNGGVKGMTTGEKPRRTKTRAVTSIGENTRLNQALWMLAEKMRELKEAA
jgi:hypothetical protein